MLILRVGQRKSLHRKSCSLPNVCAKKAPKFIKKNERGYSFCNYTKCRYYPLINKTGYIECHTPMRNFLLWKMSHVGAQIWYIAPPALSAKNNMWDRPHADYRIFSKGILETSYEMQMTKQSHSTLIPKITKVLKILKSQYWNTSQNHPKVHRLSKSDSRENHIGHTYSIPSLPMDSIWKIQRNSK